MDWTILSSVGTLVGAVCACFTIVLTLISQRVHNTVRLRLSYKCTLFLCTSYEHVGTVSRIPYFSFLCSNIGRIETTITSWSLLVDGTNPLHIPLDEHIIDSDVCHALKREFPIELKTGKFFWIGVTHEHMLNVLSNLVYDGSVQCDDRVLLCFYELSGRRHTLRLKENVQELMAVCRQKHICAK